MKIMNNIIPSIIKNLFAKREWLGLAAIGLGLAFFMAINFNVSERKARDAQRKQDVRDMLNSLESYKERVGSYPVSLNGKIVGCDSGKLDEKGAMILRSCSWGMEKFNGQRLLVDPGNSFGIIYYYISDGRFFQLYAALEGREEAEYDLKIVARNLSCGKLVCNFGLGSSWTPLDKSLEEYENELDAKSLHSN